MGLTANQALPWLIDVDVFEQAVANTNWDTIVVYSLALMNGYKMSSGAQNDSIDFNVVLAAGIWTVEVMYISDPFNAGIISVQFDTVEKGTIDTYAGSGTPDNLGSVAGIAVTATAKVVLRLKLATKNVSSGGYYGYIQHIQLRRTA